MIDVMMIDCGGYSAYVTYLKRNLDLVGMYVCLDVIPGAHGQREYRREEIEQAAARSYKNQQMMKDAGLSPIPVFHEGDGWHWLEKYLNDNELYIALAPHHRDWGGGPAHVNDKMRWLDDAFHVIDGAPVKVHGLGLTTRSILQRYPWATVDSSSWALQAGFGKVPIPQYIDGKPDYAMTPDSVRLDFIADNFLRERAQRFLTEVGIDWQEANTPLGRWQMWIRYYLGLEATLTSGCRIMFVSSPSKMMRATLAKQGVRNQLLSYFLLKEKPLATLELYMRESADAAN